MQFKVVVAFLVIMCLLVPKIKAQECATCETAVSLSQNYLKTSKDNITLFLEMFFEKECTAIDPSLTFSQNCELIMIYSSKWAMEIYMGMTPQAVCGGLDLCNKTRDSGMCAVCEVMLDQFDTFIEGNDTRGFLKSVCEFFNGSWDTCAKLARNAQDMFKKAIQVYTPLRLCQDAHLCSQNTVALKQEKQSVLCQTCKVGLGFMKNTNVTSESVKKNLELACNFFKVKDCTPITEKLDQIIQSLKTEDTNTICENIVKTCPKQ